MAHDVRPVTAPLSRALGAANDRRLYVKRMFDSMMVCGTPRTEIGLPLHCGGDHETPGQGGVASCKTLRARGG